MKGDRIRQREIPLFHLNLSQAEINYQATSLIRVSQENNKQAGGKYSFVDTDGC